MVELVCVIAAIGLVVAYALPKLTGARNQANDRAAEVALQQAASAASQWAKGNSVDADCSGAETERCAGGYAGLTIGGLQGGDRSFVAATGAEKPQGDANPYAIKWQAVPGAPYLLAMCTAGKSAVYCLAQDVQSSGPGRLGVGSSSFPAMWRSKDPGSLPDGGSPPTIDQALNAISSYAACTVTDGRAGCEATGGYPLALLPNPANAADPDNAPAKRLYQAWAPTA